MHGRGEGQLRNDRMHSPTQPEAQRTGTGVAAGEGAAAAADAAVAVAWATLATTHAQRPAAADDT